MATVVRRKIHVTAADARARVIGSAAAVITWLGSVAFLLYNSLMFVFATPANRLFLAMLDLSAWSAGAVLWQADAAAFGALFSRRTPVRGLVVCMWW